MITHKIVREHGGEISFESEKGEGAKFIIRLPAGNSRPSPEAGATSSCDIRPDSPIIQKKGESHG
jgi:hypothetical protein